MKLVRITLILGLVVSVIMSFTLWAGDRSFPLTPVFAGMAIQSPVDTLITVTMLLLLVSSLIFRWHRLLLFGVLVLATLLVLADVNRLQPWFYIYCSMLWVFVFYNGRVDDSNRFTSYFIMLQVILASVYFFCGLSQLNSSFVNSEFADIILPIKSIVSERQYLFFKKAGVVVPYLLMFIGIGLIISPIRYLAITLAVLFHVILLVLLFPSAANNNLALWFSNLPFGIMLFVLFSGKTKQRYFSPGFLFQMPLFYPVIVLFVIMPFFNTVALWPDYLSSNFRSGKNKSVIINVDRELYQKLPMYQKHFCHEKGEAYTFDYNTWCGHELRVECYPEKPVFNSIYQYLIKVQGENVKETELAVASK